MTSTKIVWFLADQIPAHKIRPWAKEKSFTLELASIKDTPLSQEILKNQAYTIAI